MSKDVSPLAQSLSRADIDRHLALTRASALEVSASEHERKAQRLRRHAARLRAEAEPKKENR